MLKYFHRCISSMEGDEHSSQTPQPPMNDNNVNMNNINPYLLDYTPLINNPFQYPSSSPLLPQPLPVAHNLDNNIRLESSNVDWVSLLSGYMNGEGSMARGLCEGDENNAGRNSKAMKSGRGKKVTPSRVAFHTRSSEDILDDGYKWRKYGQKSVKNSHHPRYFNSYPSYSFCLRVYIYVINYLLGLSVGLIFARLSVGVVFVPVFFCFWWFCFLHRWPFFLILSSTSAIQK
uniref:WRKY domain-containing protein n=1 Tax=Lactuca sativa TaxID=4236 RepID=A0A9R1W2D2_LACSA|nr:hypothetical protein LSAT_V11C300105030 [Lactuca sativa]